MDEWVEPVELWDGVEWEGLGFEGTMKEGNDQECEHRNEIHQLEYGYQSGGRNEDGTRPLECVALNGEGVRGCGAPSEDGILGYVPPSDGNSRPRGHTRQNQEVTQILNEGSLVQRGALTCLV